MSAHFANIELLYFGSYAAGSMNTVGKNLESSRSLGMRFLNSSIKLSDFHEKTTGSSVHKMVFRDFKVVPESDICGRSADHDFKSTFLQQPVAFIISKTLNISFASVSSLPYFLALM